MFDVDVVFVGINVYFNLIDIMWVCFLQILFNGVLIQGLLFMDCLGCLWFEYDDFSLIIVIVDGIMVVIEDLVLEIIDWVLICVILFYWLLVDEIDFVVDVEVIDVVCEFGFIYVIFQDLNDEMQGLV